MLIQYVINGRVKNLCCNYLLVILVIYLTKHAFSLKILEMRHMFDCEYESLKWKRYKVWIGLRWRGLDPAAGCYELSLKVRGQRNQQERNLCRCNAMMAFLRGGEKKAPGTLGLCTRRR